MIKIQFVDELTPAVEKAMRIDLVNNDTSHGIDVN